jgi:hypothetical protein
MDCLVPPDTVLHGILSWLLFENQEKQMPFDPQKFKRNFRSSVRPDAPDFRDRMYSPTLNNLPATFNEKPFADSAWVKRVKDQGDTMACTGYSLSSMVERLLCVRDKAWSKKVSEFMMYYMARLYDELPGMDELGGSTARGGMKAWHRHGACPYEKWDSFSMNPNSAGTDWQNEAFKTALGAYYRVDHTSLADMHAAISETQVIYVTADIHTGWLTPDAGKISHSSTDKILGGHAFLIVGYDQTGFWIQNSWGTSWGNTGFAHLDYSDWHQHGMDAWVGQLGVSISSVVDTVASGLDYSRRNKGVSAQAAMLSSNNNISAQQINHYIINLENNGKLSDKGQFWTTPEDIDKLLQHHLPNALNQWGIANDKKAPIHVALYAHGGLTPEQGAANTARFWLPELYANQVFPVFFMWETGLMDTLGDIVKDAMFGTAAAPRFWGAMEDKLDDRMETLLSKPGSIVWDQMKQNAYAASMDLSLPDTFKLSEGDAAAEGISAIFRDRAAAGAARRVKAPVATKEQSKGGLTYVKEALERMPENLRERLHLHLIGHSAGAIFHAHLLPHLLNGGMNVDGIYLMAPGCRVDLFDEKIWPALLDGQVRCYTQYHLHDRVELDDNCHPLPYNKSLLYLVSNSFEHGDKVPILGMQTFAAKVEDRKPPKANVWDFIASPTASNAPKTHSSMSTSHGGFDNDKATRDSIIARIKTRVPV